ncbi:MAG: hypothetical protein IH933_11905 [Euryarchaeota archaeon]|nr:hypothetical protein [Euryarchaeota archaeon]
MDPFKSDDETERPFLVLSNENHPFADQQVAAIGITTTPWPESIEISSEDWELGELPRQSYISPWIIVTRDYDDILRSIGRLRSDIVERTLFEVVEYLS